MPNAKHWCFTVFNNLDDLSRFKHPHVVYVIIGREICPNTQRLHGQGYLQFTGKKRLTWIKKHIDAGAHWENCRGSDADNYTYCNKDGNLLLEHGEREKITRQGKRTDYAAAMEAIRSGRTMLEVAHDHAAVWFPYQRAVQEYARLVSCVEAKKRAMPTIWVFFSEESGTGKTTCAEAMFPGAYWKDNGKWWDGYDGHETVVFDEWRSDIKFRQLLKLLDTSPMTVEVKGGVVPLKATTFVFTTNFHPNVWYPGVVRGANCPLTRRLREWSTLVEFPTEFYNPAVELNVVDAPHTP